MTSAEDLIAALQRAPGIVIPLVRQANPEILKRRPPSGKWSIHEHACHLAKVHALFFERLDLMLREDDASIKSYEPGRDDPEDALLHVNLEDALRRFQADRYRLVGRLLQLRPPDRGATPSQGLAGPLFNPGGRLIVAAHHAAGAAPLGGGSFIPDDLDKRYPRW
jgi:hypothetical protein